MQFNLPLPHPQTFDFMQNFPQHNDIKFYGHTYLALKDLVINSSLSKAEQAEQAGDSLSLIASCVLIWLL